jgi:hypothetical protein
MSSVPSQTSAAEIVAPSEGDDSAFAEEAVELEWLELQLLEMMNQLLLLRVRDQFLHIAKLRRKFRRGVEEFSLLHVTSVEYLSPKGGAAA